MLISEIIGFIGALLIGISLGLIGGGGSILSVPVLAYLFHLEEKIATAYSLFIVGSSAFIGGIEQSFKKLVDWRTAIVFGIPSIFGVWMVRHYVVPELPDVLFQVGNFEFTRRMGMFGLFALLMIPAAISMIRENCKGEDCNEEQEKVSYNYPLIILEGIVVGGITGFVGAGGGFLIIPALVVLAHLSMKKAVSTSLIIIGIKSLMGFFLGDAPHMKIDWHFLSIFTGITFVGIFMGSYISNFIDGKKLKKGFGFFIIIMAVFIFYMEFFCCKK